MNPEYPQTELEDDNDTIEEMPSLHSFLTIRSIYSVRHNPIIKTTLDMEKLAASYGIINLDEE